MNTPRVCTSDLASSPSRAEFLRHAGNLKERKLPLREQSLPSFFIFPPRRRALCLIIPPRHPAPTGPSEYSGFRATTRHRVIRCECRARPLSAKTKKKKIGSSLADKAGGDAEQNHASETRRKERVLLVRSMVDVGKAVETSHTM